MPTILPNPYPDDGRRPMNRIYADVWTEELNFLRRMRVERGTVQAVLNNLIHKLIHALKQRNITSYVDEAAFVDFIIRSQLVHPDDTPRIGHPPGADRELRGLGLVGESSTGTVSEAGSRDDGGRTPPARNKHTNATTVPTDPKSRHGARPRRKGGS